MRSIRSRMGRGVRALGVTVALCSLAATACGACGSFDASSETPSNGDGGPDEAATGRDDGGADGVVVGPLGDAGDGNDAADGAPNGCEAHAFGAPVELDTFGEVTSLRVKPGAMVAGAFVSYAVNADAAGSAGDEDIDEGVFPKAQSDLYSRVVTSPDIDTNPSPVTSDLRLFFEHGAPGARHIVVGVRAQTGQRFDDPPAALVLGVGTAQTREPWALGDGSILYFAAEPGEVGGRDIYRSELSAGAWTSTVLAGVSTGADEGHPVVSTDERTIFFSHATSGGPADVWMATRGATTAPFGGGAPVPGLAGTTDGGTPSDDRPTWLSADRCTLFFISNRSGAYRAYSTTRP